MGVLSGGSARPCRFFLERHRFLLTGAGAPTCYGAARWETRSGRPGAWSTSSPPRTVASRASSAASGAPPRDPRRAARHLQHGARLRRPEPVPLRGRPPARRPARPRGRARPARPRRPRRPLPPRARVGDEAHPRARGRGPQRGAEPGRGRGGGRRGAPARAHRPALARGHELHARARGHAGRPPVARRHPRNHLAPYFEDIPAAPPAPRDGLEVSEGPAPLAPHGLLRRERDRRRRGDPRRAHGVPAPVRPRAGGRVRAAPRGPQGRAAARPALGRDA